MNNFIKTPIKLTVVSRSTDNVLSHTVYIIVNNASKEVEKEIKKQPKSSNLLKNIYGANWKTKLGFDILKGKYGSQEEPVDESFSDVVLEEEDDIKFDEDDLQIDEDDLQIDTDAQIEAPIKEPVSKMDEVNWIFDVSIFPEDKISELKQKLYLITNIPIYRQHLWHETGGVTPLAYIVYKYDTKIHVDINTVLQTDQATNIQFVEGIPIDIDMYENKSDIKIVEYDGFRILKDLHGSQPSFEYFLIDANDFIGPIKNKLETMISSDKSKFDLALEMIYYSFILKYFPMMTLHVFIEYIQHEQLLGDYFPELVFDHASLNETFTKQSSIIQAKNDIISSPDKKQKADVSTIKKNIRSSITVITLNVIHNMVKKELIYLRNLFDQFDVNRLTNFIQTFLFHEGKRYLLKKTYINCVEPVEKIQEGSIMFRVYLNTETSDHLDLILFSNGNYKIKTSWREENNYGFKDIFELTSHIINPIINKINSFGDSVLRHSTIPCITWENVTFTDISVSIFYKHDIISQDFALFKQLFNELNEVKIIEERNIETNQMDYYFLKGMYRFDPMRIEKIVRLNNYYTHMSEASIKTKWDSIFIKCRILKITKRFSGIKLEINGIKKPEYDIFLDYIIYTLYKFITSKKHVSIKKHKLKDIKKLTSLKEQDPVLYDFKKKYGSDIIYSKICQKPFQPLLLTVHNYNSLNTDEKARVLKWKNHTTLEDVYYYCPNPKFPYVRFKIGKHPKGYGIPCCQKTDVPKDPTDSSRIIHEKILKDYVYLEEKRAKVSSRYIMTYGKDIESGRLSKLPENTLESLFHEEDTLNAEDCPKNTGYYLTGVSQHTLNINAVGYMFCLADVLDKTLEELIIDTIVRLNKNPQLFSILLQGQINKYFINLKSFISELKSIFIRSTMTIAHKKFSLWNTLFIDIAKYYFMINTIIFNDHCDDEITLSIPPYINYPDEFIIDGYQNLILIRKYKKQLKYRSTQEDKICYYYPMYIINKEIFFKTNIVEKKLFANNSTAVLNIHQIIIAELDDGDKISCIDLNIIKQFIKSTKKYTIELLYINKQNLCYVVKLVSTSSTKKYIHIPLTPSFYKLEGYNLSFTPYLRNKSPTQYSAMMNFVKDYNNWISRLYDKPQNKLYPSIEMKYWIEQRSPKTPTKIGKIVGFLDNDLIYYFSPINKHKALRYKNIPSSPLLYNVDDVNTTIFNDIKPVFDRRCKEINKALYKHNLYPLFVLEFVDSLKAERNKKVRNNIYKILKTYSKNLSKAIQQIYIIIDEYYKNSKHGVSDKLDDQKKISQQLRLASYQKRNMVEYVKQSYYNFDRITINKLKGQTTKQVIVELKKISKKITSIESIDRMKNFEFPNAYTSCTNFYKLRTMKSTTIQSLGYCRNKKLKITSNKLNEYIELLAGDITDPLKFKYMMSLVLVGKTLDFFKFIRRNSETIRIIVG